MKRNKAMSLSELSKEERSMVEALRLLRQAEAEYPPQVPEALKEHGLVSKERAAELLGADLEEIERLTGTNERIRPWGHTLPCVGGLIPISELRRAFSRLNKQRLLDLAQAVVDHVKVGRVVNAWLASSRFDLPEDGPEGVTGYDFAEVAEHLEVTKAEARRLMDGPLFYWGRKPLRGVVTKEELESYRRKLDATKAVAA